jgi:2-aminoethylphosphonate-pyruvate transaminase
MLAGAKATETRAFTPPAMGEPYLLTPGPLTTAYEVKTAMLKDWGSWDSDFRAMTADMRRRLLVMAGDSEGAFDCVPMQGSGTFAVEAMLGSFLPLDSKTLVLMNGAYGQRIAQTLDYLGHCRRSLRDQFGHIEPNSRNCRNRRGKRPQAADRFHERLWRVAAGCARHKL